MTDRLRRLIAWWQIICGILGILMFGAYYLNLVPNGRVWLEQTMGWVNYYAGIAFFSLCIAAGRSLLKAELWGIWTSFGCQTVQVVSCAIRQGPQINIAAGPLLGIKLTDSQFTVSAGFNSSFFLGTLVSGPSFIITVNVLALVWAALLLRDATRPRVSIGTAAA